MQNWVQDGDIISLAAPYDVSAGGGALVGTQFGVAQGDALSGAAVLLVTRGVFDLTKVESQAWTVGAAIYWDNTNKYCTTTSSGNTLIGTCMVAVGSGAGETTGRVRLKGV
jgi:predicted RecA/RadA family phage recombinase